MIVAFEQLKNYDFELSNIHVLYQKPIYRELNIKKVSVLDKYWYA